MIPVVAVVIAALIVLATLKTWRHCPICEHTYRTNIALTQHIRKAHTR